MKEGGTIGDKAMSFGSLISMVLLGGNSVDIFENFLVQIGEPDNRQRTRTVLGWVLERFPQLLPRIAWNQPMFTDHGTFIIGFSTAKKHLAAAPEREAIERFSSQIIRAGYQHSKELIRFPWDRPVDYSLLERVIAYNIADKAACFSFWRK